MRKHGLRLVLFAVEVGGQGLIDQHHAVIELLAAPIQRAHGRLHGGPVSLDLLVHFGAEGPQVTEQRFDISMQKLQDRELIARGQRGVQVRHVLAHVIRECVKNGQGFGAIADAEHLLR